MSVKEVKLCLLGATGVGKSSIVHRLVYDNFRANIEQTIGAAFVTKTVMIGEQVYKYQIWDTAGQEKYRALAPMYYHGAAAAIIVYDIAQKSSFSTVKSWLSELRRHADPDIVLAIAGNKCDEEEARDVPVDEAAEFALSQNAIFAETSAKTAVNIARLFIEIGKRLSQRDEKCVPSVTQTDCVNLQNTPKERRKCCSK